MPPVPCHHPQGLLCQPLLLAWASRDPYYVFHLLVSPLVVAGVIWPAFKCRHVVRSTRIATRTAARLMFLAFSYMSVNTPHGLLQFHLPAVMASQGRWALFTSMAWLQGLLLQVSPASSRWMAMHACIITPCMLRYLGQSSWQPCPVNAAHSCDFVREQLELQDGMLAVVCDGP